MRNAPVHGYSIRDLQSLLGVTRRVLSSLINAGFVTPTRGHRNELRFSFRDVVLLRTAYQLKAARIPGRRILRALARLKSELPDTTPLSGLRISAVGDTVTVRTGATQWDANTGQLLLDFGDGGNPDTQNPVSRMDTSQAVLQDRARQAANWFEDAERLHEINPRDAERAYRKAIALSPQPHYHAYANLGALLASSEDRCADALTIFEEALTLFEDAELLHYNRAVLLEHAGQLREAARGYLRCLEVNPHSEDAAFGHASMLERLGEFDGAAQAYIQCLQINPNHGEAMRHLEALLGKLKGDARAVIRHLSAWRRSIV
jgi:hypothetical protein